MVSSHRRSHCVEAPSAHRRAALQAPLAHKPSARSQPSRAMPPQTAAQASSCCRALRLVCRASGAAGRRPSVAAAAAAADGLLLPPDTLRSAQLLYATAGAPGHTYPGTHLGCCKGLMPLEQLHAQAARRSVAAAAARHALPCCAALPPRRSNISTQTNASQVSSGRCHS